MGRVLLLHQLVWHECRRHVGVHFSSIVEMVYVNCGTMAWPQCTSEACLYYIPKLRNCKLCNGRMVRTHVGPICGDLHFALHFAFALAHPLQDGDVLTVGPQAKHDSSFRCEDFSLQLTDVEQGKVRGATSVL
jgi:hypothetical protein